MSNREILRETMRSGGISRARAAGLLHQSIDTIDAWLKPETSRSSRPCPRWAIELLCYKADLPIPAEEPAEVETLAPVG